MAMPQDSERKKHTSDPGIDVRRQSTRPRLSSISEKYAETFMYINLGCATRMCSNFDDGGRIQKVAEFLNGGIAADCTTGNRERNARHSAKRPVLPTVSVSSGSDA